jgi:O-antigen/teichoic acid export membrane protein
MISKKFIKSSFTYSVIGSLPMVSGFVLLPFYTNLLTTDDFGMLMIYILFSQLIQIILNFGMDNFVPINFINTKDDKVKQTESVATSTILLIGIGVAFIVIFWFTGNPFFKVLNDVLYKGKNIVFSPWVFMSVVTAFFNSYFKTYTNLLVYQQRPAKYFWLNIYNFVLTIGISLAGLYLYPQTLIGPMYGRLLSGVGIFGVSFLFFAKEFGFKFRTGYLKGIFEFCYPFFLFMLLFWILNNIDRYIILHFFDQTSVGIYDFAVKCSLPIEFVQLGLMGAIMPIVFNIWKDKNLKESTLEVNRYYNGFTAVFLMSFPVYVAMIPLLVPLVVKNPVYYQSFDYFPIIVAGFISKGLYVMFLAPLMFLSKTKILPLAFALAAIIQVSASIVLIKYFGLMGATYATIVSKVVQVFFLYFFSKKYFKFQFNFNKLILLPAFYLLLVIFTEAFFPRQYWYFVQVMIILIVSFSTFFIYRNELMLLIGKYLPLHKKSPVENNN